MLELRIDEALAREVAPAGPGAAVGVLRDGVFIHRKAYGLADLEWGLPLTPDSVFRIASLTKQFTAVGVMMLIERGDLRLDDPIEAVLEEWDPRGRRVTIRHLLNHTSGIQSHDAALPGRTERMNLPLREVIAWALQAPFVFEPGARYRYNNTGYLLLGEIIARRSGVAFEDFLAAAIFKPLGMSRTGLLRHGEVTAQRARGYVRGRRGFHNARPDADGWSYAAGGLGSTLDDLARWDRALRDHVLVSPRGLEQMLAPTPLTDGALYPYGFGWGVAEYQGRRLFHHTGGVSGFASHMAHLRDERVTTIVLSNLYMFPFDRVTRALLRAALGLEPATAAGPIATADDLAACAGPFVGEDGAPFTPEASSGGQSAGLTKLGDGHFCLADDPEIELRYSDLRDGRHHVLDYVSPLWPTTRFQGADRT
jgi:CubicO group peptidase (beta-lactamase class C family)